MITVVGNMKGGTGKSTLAFNLSVWLAYNAKKPLRLFDLDPQKTLADVVEVRFEEGYQPLLPQVEFLENLTTIKNTWEHVLIDVSMSDIVALKKALAICDQVIVPVAPSQADIWSTQRFVKMIRQERDKLPKIHGVINRADTHPFVVETKQAEEALDYLPHIKRIPIRLYNRTNYRRSFSEGLAVFELAPSSKAGKEFIQFAKTIFKG